jgi:hypothetical protein
VQRKVLLLALLMVGLVAPVLEEHLIFLAVMGYLTLALLQWAGVAAAHLWVAAVMGLTILALGFRGWHMEVAVLEAGVIQQGILGVVVLLALSLLKNIIRG